MPTPIDDLCERLTLDPLDRDLFLGNPGEGEFRLFGGLVAAQSTMAAIATLGEEEKGSQAGGSLLHSIHAYFLRPGSYDRPIRFVVDRIRDGRTFTTRRVVAHQNGEAIFNMSASFARPEEGMSFQRPAPRIDGPDGLPEWTDVRNKGLGLPPPKVYDNPIEVRVLDENEFAEGQPKDPVRSVWMRPRGVIPNDPDLHTAILIYATDRTLIATAMKGAGGVPMKTHMGSSLDHAVWLHHPIHWDDWIILSSVSPIAQHARALIFAGMYDTRGVQLASIAQEALVRERRR